MPADLAPFDVGVFVQEMFEERFHPDDVADLDNLIHKRDLTSTVALLLDVVNGSLILYDLLDSIAYDPEKISAIANFTASKLSGFDLSSLSLSGISLDLNYSSIYDEVMDSGVVTLLLDGILLDTSYRPTLVKLVSRILEGNKNAVNYLVRNVFKKLKRDALAKRDNSGTLETFLGNVISSVLNSQLVASAASDLLVALNETQFLTSTVKRLIADEGYQNMTAQLVLDIYETGELKFNAESLNITSIASKALSNPAIIVSLVSNLLSGNVQVPGLGDYSDAVSDILKEVEDDGVFADLNNYVFSQTHSVTYPIIATNQIVVAKTTSTKTSTKTSTSKSTSESSKAASKSASSVVSSVASEFDDFFSDLTSDFASVTETDSDSETMDSAAQVSSILALLGASTAAESTTESIDDSDETLMALSSGDAGILAILAALGSESTSADTSKRESNAKSVNAASLPLTTMMKLLVAGQMGFLGAVLLL